MSERPGKESEISSKLVPFPVIPSTKEKDRPNSRRIWLIAGLASLLIAAIAAGTWWGFANRNTVHYVTAPVALGTVTRTVTATGTVNPELTIIVGAAVSGVIQNLYCDYNTQANNLQQSWRFDWEPPKAVLRDVWTIVWILGC
jgi:HlyD family secretion protein